MAAKEEEEFLTELLRQEVNEAMVAGAVADRKAFEVRPVVPVGVLSRSCINETAVSMILSCSASHQ
jgi:hypothetical protein